MTVEKPPIALFVMSLLEFVVAVRLMLNALELVVPIAKQVVPAKLVRVIPIVVRPTVVNNLDKLYVT